MADYPKKSEDSRSGSFTVEPDQSGIKEMPSITKLLNRKKLGLSSAQDKKSPPASPPPVDRPPQAAPLAPEPTPPLFSIEPSSPSVSKVVDHNTVPPPPGPAPRQAGVPIEIEVSPENFEIETNGPVHSPASSSNSPEQARELEIAPDHATSNVATIRIQPAAPRQGRLGISKLNIWPPQGLKSGADPLGRGLAKLFEKGAHCALFLSVKPPEREGSVPHFVASAAVTPGKKQDLWTGVKWDPAAIPELWNQFIKVGFVEFPPPATVTNQKSARNAMRAAFGVDADEWLLLVRCGPSNACRGVVAVVSRKSLLTDLSLALPMLTAAAPKKAA